MASPWEISKAWQDYANTGNASGLEAARTGGNPNDPDQLRTWALDLARRTAEGSELYTPYSLESLSRMFSPYFKQAQSSYADRFNQSMNSQVGQAQNQAGAYAAYKGLNPASFVQSAGQGVRSSMTPGFLSGMSDLLNNQNNALMGATAQSNQFKTGNLMNAANMILGGSQMAQQTWDQPGFWDYIMSGIGSGIGNLPIAFGA